MFRFCNGENVNPSCKPKCKPFQFFRLFKPFKVSSSLPLMYYYRHEYKKNRKKRLYRRSKAVSALSGACYQARLNNHCTFRVFGNVINQSSM